MCYGQSKDVRRVKWEDTSQLEAPHGLHLGHYDGVILLW